MQTKVTIKREIKEEIFVEFPCYRDFGAMLYKVESETNITGVHKANDDRQGIEVHPNGKWLVDLVLSDKTPRPITKEQFTEAYNSTLSLLNQQSFIQDTEPATEEDCRIAAYEVYERNEELQDALNDLR